MYRTFPTRRRKQVFKRYKVLDLAEIDEIELAIAPRNLSELNAALHRIVGGHEWYYEFAWKPRTMQAECYADVDGFTIFFDEHPAREFLLLGAVLHP